MAAGFISLPSELICHILLLLTPKDICHCAMTCKTVCAAARDSVHIQYKLELYAQGFTETAALDLVDFSTKMSSLKKLASLWRTDFYTKPVFEEVVGPVNNQVLSGKQHVKCGLWWTMANSNLCIRDCNANGKLSQTWSTHSLTTGGRFLKSVIVDPLQDLLIIVSSLSFIVIDAVQDYQVFMVEFRLASSNLPHPDSACAFLECTHTPDAPGQYASYVMDELAICGDRIVVLYRIHPAQDLFIQVIDWRKGHAKSYNLHPPVGRQPKFRLVDKQTIVVIGEDDFLTLYTLREPDGSPQRRIIYHLPELKYDFPVSYAIHTTPLFHSTAARTDLMPGYVPLLESQIMVLEFISQTWSGIFVIDMVIFSEHAIQSEMPVEIPWSDWGPHHTWCFPHYPNHQISVFGSKMAYALPGYRSKPGEKVNRYFQGHYYVHIWDFNKRIIARAENGYDCSSPVALIRKPDRVLADYSCFVGDIISNHPYIATVCRTPFKVYDRNSLFLEQDRLVLTGSDLRRLSANIQVVVPVRTEVGTDFAD